MQMSNALEAGDEPFAKALGLVYARGQGLPYPLVVDEVLRREDGCMLVLGCSRCGQHDCAYMRDWARGR